VDTIAVLLVDSSLDVILNYAPVVLLFLAMNILGLRQGTGSMQMIIGILILSAASAIQAHNGLYHVVSVFGVVFLYLGGATLETKAT
jgi:intracellular septation protein A